MRLTTELLEVERKAGLLAAALYCDDDNSGAQIELRELMAAIATAKVTGHILRDDAKVAQLNNS